MRLNIVQHMITTPTIMQTIFIAFLLLFPLIRPSSKIGTTSQMHNPKITDIIISQNPIYCDDSLEKLFIKPSISPSASVIAFSTPPFIDLIEYFVY